MFMLGSRGDYDWLVTDDNFDFLELCPEIVLGKYLAVTSFDSGEFVPTDEEMAAGWQNRAKIAYSPKIESVEGVPRAGWDEWYIFNTPTDLGTSHLADNIFEMPQEHGHLSVLVNYGFALHPPERAHVDLTNVFWAQIMRVHPESYLADNEFLTFVSMNQSLFVSVRDAVKSRLGEKPLVDPR